jgi:hypothetical protein
LTQNSPVSQGDRVSTGANSRVELQLDYADVLRLADNATANITNLSRGNIQVQIAQGLVNYSVLRGGEAVSEIDTPNIAVKPSGPGEYRIQVLSESETQVTIRSGSADISTPDGSTHVEQGQMITVEGADSPQYKTEQAGARDEWDSWNEERDRHITGASSWGRTDHYYTGSEDLDQHGTWSEVPDYGPVWTPNEGPDWAPYRDGRWVWEPYYGWTWVSYEPWGWAPYHYGRWFVYGGNWVWWPGPVGIYPGYYPVWAPAYVSFFGFGGGVGFGIGFGFGFGFGHFGWLPCGPGDWYHPWFGRWGGRVNNVNITNVNNFHEGFAPLGGNRARQFSNFHDALNNERVRNGISSQAGNEFGRSAVSRNQTRLSSEEFRSGTMMGGKMPVTPSRESFSPSGRSAGAGSMHTASVSSRHFFNSSRSNSSFSRGGQSGFGGNHNFNSSSVQSGNRSGWQKFSSPSGSSNRSGQGFGADNRSSNNSGRGSFGSSGSAPRNESSNRGWQHFTPPTSSSRGGSSNSYNSYSRPPLNMRQPIVTPRGGSSTYGNRSYGEPHGYSVPGGTNTYGNRSYGSSGYGSSNSRTYGEPHGYSTPGGGYSTPREYRAPQNGASNPRSYGGNTNGGFRGYGESRGGNGGTPREYRAPRGGSSSGGHSSEHSSGGHSGGGHGSHR